MGLYLLSNKKRLETHLNKALLAIGGDQVTALNLVRLPPLSQGDTVFIDFDFFTRLTLTQIDPLLLAARERRVRLIFLVRKQHKVAITRTLQALGRSPRDLLPLPLMQWRLKRILR